MGRFIRHLQPVATRIYSGRNAVVVPGGLRNREIADPTPPPTMQFEIGVDYEFESGDTRTWEHQLNG